jgi:hypothetical protein
MIIFPIPPIHTDGDVNLTGKDILIDLIVVVVSLYVFGTLVSWLMDISLNEPNASLLHTLKWQLEFVKKLKIK